MLITTEYLQYNVLKGKDPRDMVLENKNWCRNSYQFLRQKFWEGKIHPNLLDKDNGEMLFAKALYFLALGSLDSYVQLDSKTPFDGEEIFKAIHCTYLFFKVDVMLETPVYERNKEDSLTFTHRQLTSFLTTIHYQA